MTTTSDNIRETRRKRVAAIRRTAQRIAVKRGCADCGSRENLEWHHDKESREGKHHRTVTQAKTWAQLDREIAVSVVLCSSCHHKRHHPPRNCTRPDCERKHYAKGLCFMHYLQEWRANR